MLGSTACRSIELGVLANCHSHMSGRSHDGQSRDVGEFPWCRPIARLPQTRVLGVRRELPSDLPSGQHAVEAGRQGLLRSVHQ